MMEAASRVPPPPGPRQRRGLNVEPPKIDQPAENLANPNTGIQDLNFKVSPELHKAFKAAAAMKGLAMKELLEACFRCWVELYGDDTIKRMLPPK